ncbi:MAG: phosphatidate cytidylyltransferase, partial [bacterium]
MAFSKLAKRVGAGAVLIPIVLFITYRGGLLFAAFVALLAGLGSSEFANMASARGFRVSRFLVIPGSALIALAFYFGSIGTAAIILTVIVLMGLMEGLARADIEKYVLSASLSIAAVTYTGWLLGFFILLREFPAHALDPGLVAAGDMGRSLVFLVLILAWSNDSGAYFVGSAIGRRKLMARVSPSKTVEGALGGLTACVIAAFISRATFAPFLAAWQAVVVGVLVGAACVVGDLAESMLKRSTGVKDSSNLIPGHGGLLDRFDSLLFAGPVFYLFARLVFSG